MEEQIIIYHRKYFFKNATKNKYIFKEFQKINNKKKFKE